MIPWIVMGLLFQKWQPQVTRGAELRNLRGPAPFISESRRWVGPCLTDPEKELLWQRSSECFQLWDLSFR